MWVAVTLASLAIVVILVLCVPLDMALHIDVSGKPRFRMRLVWLFGLVSKEIGKGKKKPEKERGIAEAKPKRRRKIMARAIFRILRTKGMLRQVKDFLWGILSRLKVRDLAVDLRVGLDNPADTGLLFAVIGPATFALNSSFPHRIRVQPSLAEAVCEGHLYGTIRLRPIQLIKPSLRFIFSLTTIRVVKKLALTKWKRKK